MHTIIDQFPAAVREETIDGTVWRLRILDPAMAVEANIFIEMLATTVAREENPELPPQQVDERRAAQIQATILQACVCGAAPVGQPMQAVRLVQNPEQQDAEKGLLWYGSLIYANTSRTTKTGKPVCLAAVLTALCLRQVLEAREALRPFRGPAQDAVDAGQDGEPVRENAR